MAFDGSTLPQPPLPEAPFGSRLPAWLWPGLVILAVGIVGSGLLGRTWGNSIGVPALIVTLLCWVAWPVLDSRAYERGSVLSYRLLSAGHFDDAERVLTPLGGRRWYTKAMRAFFLMHLAAAKLGQGRVAEALSLYRSSLEGRGLGTRIIEEFAAPGIALAYALLGETENASLWLEAVKRQLAPNPDQTIEAEMVIALRKGLPQVAEGLFEEAWPKIRGSAQGNILRAAQLLQAFALMRRGKEGELEPLLSQLRPAGHDEFLALTSHWPELDAFVDSRVAPSAS
jgi:hypothetical protein